MQDDTSLDLNGTSIGSNQIEPWDAYTDAILRVAKTRSACGRIWGLGKCDRTWWAERNYWRKLLEARDG